jgi:hypothetical protein
MVAAPPEATSDQPSSRRYRVLASSRNSRTRNRWSRNTPYRVHVSVEMITALRSDWRSTMSPHSSESASFNIPLVTTLPGGEEASRGETDSPPSDGVSSKMRSIPSSVNTSLRSSGVFSRLEWPDDISLIVVVRPRHGWEGKPHHRLILR